MNEPDGNETLTIHLNPGPDGTETAFADMDYLNEDSLMKMVLENQKSIVGFKSEALAIDSTIEVMCRKRPKKVLLNGDPLEFMFDSGRKIMSTVVTKETAIDLMVVN